MTLPNLIAPDGALPVNTAGGNLAEGFVHGIELVLEAVRQARRRPRDLTRIDPR